MAKHKLKVENLTCGSCEKVIRRSLEGQDGVSSLEFDFSGQTVTVEHDPEKLPLDRIKEIIRGKGYPVGYHRPAKRAREQEEKYLLEKRMVKTALLTFIVLLTLEGIAYMGFFKDVPDFFPKYGAHMLYLTVGVVANATAIWHIRCYRPAVDCMTGMMIGMTVGMMSGFMGGAVVGATNGMFTGAVYGMVIGMVIGAWCGKCCGIMGALEGLMAGLMAGTMGAMLSVMMLNDRIQLFMPVLFAACLAILIGLAYMVYERNKEDGPVRADHDLYDISMFIMLCYLVTFVTAVIMVYGPKSILVS